MRDRRALFFVAAAVVCFLLSFVADNQRWFARILAAVYIVLAAASLLDFRSHDRLAARVVERAAADTAETVLERAGPARPDRP